MRKWGLAGLMILCVNVFAQDKNLTITIPGLTVRNAVAKIAEQTGEKLEVDDSANYNTLVLHLTDVPLEEALERIARVTTSYWQKVDDKRVLQIDSEKIRNHRRSETAARAARLKEEAERLFNTVKPWSQVRDTMPLLATAYGEVMNSFIQTTEGHKERQSFESQLPTSRFLRKIAKLMPWDKIAELEMDESLEFSPNPTSSQQAMTPAMMSTVREYHQEFVVWHNAAKETMLQYAPIFSEDVRVYHSAIEGAPESLKVSVYRGGRGERHVLSTKTANEQGQIIEQAFVILESYDPLAEVPDLGLANVQVPIEKRHVVDIAFRPMSKTLLDGTPFETAYNETKHNILEPDKNELLSGYVGWILSDSAKGANKQLVALLPDDALLWQYDSRTVSQENITGLEIAGLVNTKWHCSSSANDGWIEIQPRYPASSIEHYIDREALAKLNQSVASNGTVTVDAARAYASAQSSSYAFGWMEMRMVEILATALGNVDQAEPIYHTSRKALQLLAIMTNGELTAAGRPGGVSMTQLSKRTVDLLDSWIFKSIGLAGFQNKSHPKVEINDWKFDTPRWIDNQPRNALVDGIPPGAKLSISMRQERAVFFETGIYETARLPRSELWDFMGMHGERMFDLPNPPRLKVVQTDVLVISIDFGTVAAWEFTVMFVPACIDSGWLSPGDLPDALREELVQGWQDYKTRAEAARNSRVVTTPPPIN